MEEYVSVPHHGRGPPRLGACDLSPPPPGLSLTLFCFYFVHFEPLLLLFHSLFFLREGGGGERARRECASVVRKFFCLAAGRTRRTRVSKTPHGHASVFRLPLDSLPSCSRGASLRVASLAAPRQANSARPSLQNRRVGLLRGCPHCFYNIFARHLLLQATRMFWYKNNSLITLFFLRPSIF